MSNAGRKKGKEDAPAIDGKRKTKPAAKKSVAAPESKGKKRREAGGGDQAETDRAADGKRTRHRVNLKTRTFCKDKTTKRAKHKYYQNQPFATVSHHLVRASVIKHLDYAHDKYPVEDLVPILNGTNEACRVLSGTEVSAKPYRSELPSPKGKNKKIGHRFQISECAINKILLYLGKRSERWLAKAGQNTARRKAQTTTTLDFCEAVQDSAKILM